MTQTSEQERAADRVRAVLADRPTTREVPMFGGLSFMVEDRMVVAVQGGGDLLVRVDPTRGPELLARPGAAQAEMGTGRSMGPGWVSVARAAIADEEALSFWMGVALEFHAAAPLTRPARRAGSRRPPR